MSLARLSRLRLPRTSRVARKVIPTYSRYNSSLPRSGHPGTTTVDAQCIPTQRTWSVNDLLSSYPKPTISSATLDHIHTLSALIPPREGSPERKKLTEELEDLVKLVEAVKLADSSLLEGTQVEETDIPDGRVWAEDKGIDITPPHKQLSGEETVKGRALLDYASRTADNLYVVEADRRKTSGS